MLKLYSPTINFSQHFKLTVLILIFPCVVSHISLNVALPLLDPLQWGSSLQAAPADSGHNAVAVGEAGCLWGCPGVDEGCPLQAQISNLLRLAPMYHSGARQQLWEGKENEVLC